MEWATLPLKRYAEFTGRSRRKEYWMFVLLCVVVYFVLYLVESAVGLGRTVMNYYGPLTLLFQLAVLVPSIAVGIRRLHDTNRSGWWLMIGYGPMILGMILPFFGMAGLGLAMIVMVVALIGFVVLIIFMALEGNRGPNQYGPDPKGSEAAPVGAA